MSTTTAAPSRLLDRLRRETTAELRFDAPDRWLYATDASLYQVEPVGVVLPRTVDDLASSIRIAAEEGVSVCPRGAATSLSGQTVGEGLILDLSKHLNRIGIVDRDRMTVRVEPGVVLDRLNAHLKPLGLMFGPDVSTSDRATLGGMIGNNSAGARSLRYGKTVDHVRSLDVVLDDGERVTLGPVAARGAGRRLCPARSRRVACTRASATRSTAIATAIIRALPQDPPAGQRLQPRRVRPRPARPRSGMGRRALGVQPRPADRRLGGDARDDRRGRGQGRADPSGARAGRSSRSPRSPPRSTAWPRSSRPARRPSRCSTG